MNRAEKMDAHSEFEPRTRHLSLVTPAGNNSHWDGTENADVELKLSFGQTTLIYQSLQAVKALGAFAPQDELLQDTLHLVDLALEEGF
jgi:hypothetical protein